MIKRIARRRKRLLSVTGVVAALCLGGMASFVTAYANTGLVTATETCTSWSAAVSLNNNVSPDHTVDVTSTIPGTPNITGGSYKTTGDSGNTLIWSYSGAAPATGTVTLTIYNPNGTLDSSAEGGIALPTGCPPSLTITKTADAASVPAGSQIGFVVTLKNTGAGSATGVTVNDPLPSGSGVTWSIASQTAPSICVISGGKVSCGPFTLSAGASEQVHVVGQTAANSCGAYNNTASYTSSNGGNGSATAVETVNCPPSLTITKTAYASSVSAGSPIGFVITLTNSGNGAASGVTLTDPLPPGSGVTWSIASQSGPQGVTCSITGAVDAQSVGCGTFTLAVGASEQVHVVGTTKESSCGTYNNTASYTSSNGGNGSAKAVETVNCSTPTSTSTPTPNSGVVAIATATPSGAVLAISVPDTGGAGPTGGGWGWLSPILVLLGSLVLVAQFVVRRQVRSGKIKIQDI